MCSRQTGGPPTPFWVKNDPGRDLKCTGRLSALLTTEHRLRPIDTHLALYTMLYNSSTKK